MTHAVDEIRHQALRRLAIFAVFLAVVLFVPAGTLNYWQAWIYWLLFTGLSVGSTLYFVKHDPALVRRRMHAGARAETEKSQKRIMALTSVCFLLLYLVPSLDHRWQWSSLPPWLSLAADLGVALVRHPMYAGAVVMFGCTPLALGSYWGLLVMLAIVPALAWRLIDEERYLKQHLPGYADYCTRVRYRLIPGIW